MINLVAALRMRGDAVLSVDLLLLPPRQVADLLRVPGRTDVGGSHVKHVAGRQVWIRQDQRGLLSTHEDIRYEQKQLNEYETPAADQVRRRHSFAGQPFRARWPSNHGLGT